MKYNKILACALAVAATFTTAKAQDVDGGLLVGVSQYQGDLSKAVVELPETFLDIGLFGRYYLNPRFNFKANIFTGQIRGDDARGGKDEWATLHRNLNFKSNLTEAGIQGEFNILPYISNSKKYRFAPYIFVGASLFHFNPKAQDGTKLHELGTEGQFVTWANADTNKMIHDIIDYKLTQVAIPFGLGIKYSLGNFWNVGFEIGQRKTFTDYLDDVSFMYPDKAALLATKNGPKAVEYSYRGGAGRPAGFYPSNKGRGSLGNIASHNPTTPYDKLKGNNLDMYIFSGLTISKTFRRFSCTNF